MSDVAIAYFSNSSLAEFMASPKIHLGHRHKCNLNAGTIIVLINLDKREVIAACTLENWEGTDSPCRPHNFLDADLYMSDPRARAYNKYDIKISDLRILKNPVTLETVRFLIGGAADYKGHTNLWKGHICNYAAPFLEGDDQAPLDKYIIWARSLV
jgi:hypothetical protein